ncbi:MAG: hypothetical protein AB8B69_04875 [Chitinophagales bacterium]
MRGSRTMIYGEIVSFIAANNLQKSIALQPMDVVKQRSEELIFKEKNNTISIEEWSELKYLLILQSLVRLANGRDFKSNIIN